MLLERVYEMFITPPLKPKLSAVAKRICDQCGWEVSNLKLQKLIYISHMFHLGKHNKPLVSNDFQAWMYGPVIPLLYHKLKGYGSNSVRDRFYEVSELDDSEIETIDTICKHLKGASGGHLVALTHREGGAWSKHYKSGVCDSVIPREDIKVEYDQYYT